MVKCEVLREVRISAVGHENRPQLNNIHKLLTIDYYGLNSNYTTEYHSGLFVE